MKAGLKTMNYEESMKYIHSIMWRGSKLGLSRMRELLGKLQNPQNKLEFIHIAGTNGKGSTAAMIASILSSAGYQTGLFTSPFINYFNERIAINGSPISDEELAEITSYVRPFADEMEDPPTEFELITAVGMEYFCRKKCDIVILEVGLGGSLDSTNVIAVPKLAVITAIGLDHTRELGDNISSIAQAKAGIIKENGTVLAYGQNQEAEAVFAKVCKDKKARLYYPDYQALSLEASDWKGHHFSYKNLQGLYLPLAGIHQLSNVCVVLKAVELLRQSGMEISDRDISKGLAMVKWPGRLEILLKHPLLILDGGHNPQGVEAAAKSLSALSKGQPVVFVCGLMTDKDVTGILKPLIPLAVLFVTVEPPNARAMPADQLAAHIEQMGKPAHIADSVEQGVDLALQKAGHDGIVCAIGSLYMSGVIRTHIRHKLQNETR